MIEIRQGNWNDLKDLVAIKLESLMVKDTLQAFFVNEIHKRWVLDFTAGMRVLILFYNHQLSGFINYYHYVKRQRDETQVSVMDKIYITPELRRRGLGRKLYQAFRQEVTLIKHRQIRVYLEDNHPILRQFYEALGLEEGLLESEYGKCGVLTMEV